MIAKDMAMPEVTVCKCSMLHVFKLFDIFYNNNQCLNKQSTGMCIYMGFFPIWHALDL